MWISGGRYGAGSKSQGFLMGSEGGGIRRGGHFTAGE